MRFFLTFFLLLALVPAAADDWQGRLADDLPLTRVALPGAHDAGTGNGFIPSQARWAAPGQTQGRALAEQFAAGVRAFDLRPAVVSLAGGVQLQIFHGTRQTNISLADAFNTIIDSLAAHPSEFVVVIINHEAAADGDSPLWADALATLLAEMSDHIADYSPALTVGALRGKMLVLSRQQYTAPLRGGLIDAWSFAADLDEQMLATVRGPAPDSVGHLYVQDYYDTTADKLTIKVAAIEALLAASAASAADGSAPLVINHTSGYASAVKDDVEGEATTAAYVKNAATTNPQTVRLLRSYPLARGIIVMDYAGVDHFNGMPVYGAQLVRAVIEQNFR